MGQRRMRARERADRTLPDGAKSRKRNGAMDEHQERQIGCKHHGVHVERGDELDYRADRAQEAARWIDSIHRS